MTRALFALASLGLLASCPAEPLALAKAHVRQHAVFRGERPKFADHRADIDRHLTSRDPETTATSFLHGIRRHAAKLLTASQATHWESLLNERQPQLKRLHDERNVLRGVFFAKAWALPSLDQTERAAAMIELKQWLRVWLDITLHERIAQHHLCRDAWEILTADQRTALVRGDWDQFVRKSTGHKRAYFGDRVVSKALGKPDHPQSFNRTSASLAQAQVSVQDKLLDAEQRWRILTFAQPPVSDELLAAEWNRTAAALGEFFLDQVDHIVRLTEAGYDLTNPSTRQRIARQPERELKALADKVNTKLTAGAGLHKLLLAK